MKSLLKLIAVFTIATTPVITVVACDGAGDIKNPNDIRNAAASLITDSDVNMNETLKLEDLKAMKSQKFSDFTPNIQNAITTFFANKVKKDGKSNWHHDSAQVVISDIIDPDLIKKEYNIFKLPVSDEVNGNIHLQAQITYKQLPPVIKNIKLFINNDITSVEEKLKAINKYLTEDALLNHKLNFMVESLPPVVLVKNSNTPLNNISQPLRIKISEVIDYSKLTLEFSIKDQDTTIFTMNKPDTKNNELVFSGTLDNIIIYLKIGTESQASEVDTTTITKKIVITQDNASASTQIQEMIKTGDNIIVKTLPDADQTFDDANKKVNMENEIKNKLFTRIAQYYSWNNNPWTSAIITIDNKDSVRFVSNLEDKNNGSFSLTIILKHTFNNIDFKISTENVTISLLKNQ